jgi:hypothetical protein
VWTRTRCRRRSSRRSHHLPRRDRGGWETHRSAGSPGSHHARIVHFLQEHEVPVAAARTIHAPNSTASSATCLRLVTVRTPGAAGSRPPTVRLAGSTPPQRQHPTWPRGGRKGSITPRPPASSIAATSIRYAWGYTWDLSLRNPGGYMIASLDHSSEGSLVVCRAATCRVCGKASWTGCGQHVEQVMRGIPRNQRCSCGPNYKAPSKGLLARLFGR